MSPAAAMATTTPTGPNTSSNTERRINIVLTGASGYLGQHILHSFLTTEEESSSNSNNDNIPVQYHIYALYGSCPNFPDAVQQSIASSSSNIGRSGIVTFDVESVDLTNEASLEEWFSQLPENMSIDVCIHTAAMSSPRLCQDQPEMARKINVPTIFFDSLMKKKGCNRIIALSTDQVYDGKQQHRNDAATPYTEQSKAEAINVYGQTKLQMEDYLLNKVNPLMVATLLRSSILLGPRAPFLPEVAHGTFLHFIASRENQDTTFYTDECRNVLAVSDMVACIRWFCCRHYQQQQQQQQTNGSGSNDNDNEELDLRGIFNAGGPASVSRHDMAVTTFEYLGYAKNVLKAEEKGYHQPTSSAAAVVPSPLDISMDSSKIVNMTGLSFRTLEEMVQITFADNTVADALS